MWLMYFFIMFLLLSISNVYVVWLMMEMMFLFFFLIILMYETKSVGLMVYFFFQSFMSLFLLMSLILFLDKWVMFLLFSKLGLFPFFYWMVVVSMKVGLLANCFVLGFQKVSVFWMFWLVNVVSVMNMMLFVYLSMFFVIVSLVNVSDFWLLLVYSSISNTAMIMLSIWGEMYLFVVFLYVGMILFILNLVKGSTSHSELLMILFFFLTVPPFVLFFMKFFIMLSLISVMKIAFFLVFFDVFVLLYYFSMIFMQFMIMEVGIMVYMMNVIILCLGLLFSNCVTMIVFY